MTRAQRARIGVRLNRRQPSEQDLVHAALYQANQKAYEATFLKHFVNHALHASQIEQCFQDGTDVRSNVQKYITSVSANVNGITNKIIWNAHCRAVNLFANASKDGAPFWDTSSFNRSVFADFNPGNATLVAHKMNEWWHRTAPRPPMVRYTTKDYPIGHHSSSFEEIDEVARTLFSREAFSISGPTGRTVKQPAKRKAKGRGLPGASIRDRTASTRSDNWLASLIPSSTVQEHREPSPEAAVPVDTRGNTSADAEPRILNDLRQLQGQRTTCDETIEEPLLAVAPRSNIDLPSVGLTQLEQLFEQFGADALSGHPPSINIAPNQEQVNQVPTWLNRLLHDHKRRLTQRSPQVFRRTLPGIRAVIAEAISQGYHPVDPDFEELVVDIESREQSETASTEMFEEEPSVAHFNEQVQPSKQISAHGKKRKREQPALIQMFNKPIERSKKKCKVDAAILIPAGPSVPSDSANRPRKQKITTSASFNSTPKISMTIKQKASSHATAVSNDPTPLPPHPSGSKTLEPYQHLPPGAYFAPQSPFEKPVWRCGIKHALGHYYNAGDRKNCPGCFTALSDNTNAKTMDFYLPSRTHYHQPNPSSLWRPSKPFGTTYGRARRSKHLSHNSIAKEAYWAAVAAGADTDEARTVAVDAVLEHLKPKPPPREPIPEPTPELEPDLGPHPSGSLTMEHGQDIPSCSYFSRYEHHEEFAWRCDINHALGRYYLAGDKRSCPGCGSNKGGLGKHTIMDFYLPPGMVVRQEIESCRWKPRKPYKMREVRNPVKRKGGESTHNQIASRKYWAAIDAGRAPDDALVWAVEETDRWLDEREDEAVRKAEEREKVKCVKTASKRNERSKRGERSEQIEYGDPSILTSSTALNAARARNGVDSTHSSDSDEDMDDADHDETDHDMDNAAPVVEVEETSSDDKTSSGSDSE